MDRELVGVVKQGPVEKWLQQKRQWDQRFASTKRKVHKQAVKDLAVGYEGFGEGELPPPSALAGRRKKDGATKTRRRTKNTGFALWSLWGSKHDKMTMNREIRAEKDNQEVEFRPASATEGQGARSFGDIENQASAAPKSAPGSPQGRSRRPSRKRRVTYERQDKEADEHASATDLVAKQDGDAEKKPSEQLLSPGYQLEVGIGSTGKRPYVGGIAVPFSLKKEAETASMLTLTSHMSHMGPDTPRTSTSRPMSPEGAAPVTHAGEGEETAQGNSNSDTHEGKGKGKEVAVDGDATTVAEAPAERPGLETFATAQEDLPTVKKP